MTNIFTTAEGDLLKAGSFLLNLSSAALSIFNKEKAVAPAVAESAVTLFADVEALISLAAPAVGASGLNFPADSAVYAQFLKLVADAKAFASSAEAALKAIA